MNLIFAGHRETIQREHNERAWLAWHIEALRRQKKLPKLEKMLIKERKRQTWQQQMQVMGMWAAVMKKIERAEAARK